jgi:hypothetical protein
VLFSLEEASTHWSHDTTWRYVAPSTTSPYPPRRPIHHVAPFTTTVAAPSIRAHPTGRCCARRCPSSRYRCSDRGPTVSPRSPCTR